LPEPRRVQKDRMPLQNRVTPSGEIVASEARGALMGNRGCFCPDRPLRKADTRTTYLAVL
jgi:hypothetical protein